MIRHVANVVLIGALAAQIALAASAKDLRPHWDVVPPVPTERFLDAAAFGDNQFVYRILAMNLQNFGDTGGRITALRDYDMEKVVDWLRAMDGLDYSADHHVTLAARYFSQTQDKPEVIHLIRYIQRHVERDPKAKLPWLSEALHMAQVRLKDTSVVLEIARQLGSYDFPEMTPLAYQLPATIHESAGDYKGAADYMARAARLLEGEVGEGEMQFMKRYVADMRARALTSESAK